MWVNIRIPRELISQSKCCKNKKSTCWHHPFASILGPGRVIHETVPVPIIIWSTWVFSVHGKQPTNSQALVKTSLTYKIIGIPHSYSGWVFFFGGGQISKNMLGVQNFCIRVCWLKGAWTTKPTQKPKLSHLMNHWWWCAKRPQAQLVVNLWFGAQWFGILRIPLSNNSFQKVIPGNRRVKFNV